ncbi:hypothetical protein GE061_012963 [Apolygus lucorum]|uniref:CHK kinase-like domain-containing protein n=1 Tax=Apolygus lucorum TaxID=248454 RepID=A0A8S9XTT2_APOLU|nr:hypothetical protein GE061_012963 [Apolygus lucorum]
MEILSLNECRRIAQRCTKSDDIEVLSYDLRQSTDAAAGFIGSAQILHIVAKTEGGLVELDLFTKTLPTNDYHRKNVETTGVFYKEAEFFKAIYPGISRFFNGKTIPVCYHAEPNFLVFENLMLQGYKNTCEKGLFDVSHCKAALASLASFHASSFLFEKSMGSTIDKMYPHLGCDKIAWFKNEKGHPGYEHCMTGARSLGVVLDAHFSHVPVKVRNGVKSLLLSIPSMILPSKNYRNALSHSDLWCNNVMFKYDALNNVENCILVDFQLWGYCPPAMDVHAIIHITTDKSFREKHEEELLKFYFKTFKKCVEVHGVDSDEFLTWEEFQESASEAVPLAVTNHALFLQICLLPESELSTVFQDITSTREFYEKDRSPVVLRGLEIDETYRSRLFAALNDCIDYVAGQQ